MRHLLRRLRALIDHRYSLPLDCDQCGAAPYAPCDPDCAYVKLYDYPWKGRP
jgi:hypothetical protein